MDYKIIEGIINSNYSLIPNNIEKIKNVYKIECDNGMFSFKLIPYEKEHFNFILGAMEYLKLNGFNSILEIIKTNYGKKYVEYKKTYGYLTRWVEARTINYENPCELVMASENLAYLHKKSKGFYIKDNMKPRIMWGMWPLNFKSKERDLLYFKKLILDKKNKTDFDFLYLSMIEEEVLRAEQSIESIIRSDYEEIMKKEVVHGGFCHHDYANHNILKTNSGEIYIIDFDYCVLDSHIHDLASLLLRKMKNDKWDMGDTKSILEAYDNIYRVYDKEIHLMACFMEFPQDFWQVGLQYYVENQPWSEEFFNKKLNRVYNDRELKQKFIDKFKKYEM
ncbi:MAG: CotS family spore coat protein [Clostridiaceae bacterium]